MTIWSKTLGILTALWFALLSAVPDQARAEGAPPTEVDLALVLAVDVSFSMDPDEQRLQREGFVEAFRSGQVHEAIRGGMLGRIAVVYLEWANAADQSVLVPWTVIGTPEEATAFADRLAAKPTRRAYWTSVSGAIDTSMALLAESGLAATRRVIDVSGDGPNNQGRAVTLARDEAVRAGVAINGLPIMLKRPTGAWDLENLDGYYRDCVIGGQGAFLVSVREREQFGQAIKTKILLEISGLTPPEPLVRLAQAEERADCFVGEAQIRRRRMDN